MRARFSVYLLLLFGAAASAAVPVGSVAIYSDGSVEKFLAAEAGQLRWEDDRKRLLVRSDNPIIPLLEKTEFLSRTGYRQRVGSGDPDAIRRLPAGTPVAFSVVRTKHSGQVSQRNWECVRQGSRKEKVLGVERSLDRYVCERFVLHRKLHNRSFREKREFSYSPALGLVVDLQRTTRTKTSSRRLVALYRPGKTGYKTISGMVRKIRSGK